MSPPHPLLVDGTLLIRARILFMGPPASRPDYLPQLPSVNALCIWGDTNVQSVHSRLAPLPAQKERSFSCENDTGDRQEVCGWTKRPHVTDSHLWASGGMGWSWQVTDTQVFPTHKSLALHCHCLLVEAGVQQPTRPVSVLDYTLKNNEPWSHLSGPSR